jgi:aspartate kinase
VVGGFVGATTGGATTTLGRGGSDTSAAVIGAALEAQEIQIWTDVDGLMSADPRLVPAAHTVPRASFAEAAELAFYGAKVLHPDSLAPAVRLGIPVRVLNASRPGEAGTLIVDGDEPTRASPIVSVASRGGVLSVRVLGRRLRADPEFAAGILGALRARSLAPDLVVASEIGVHLVLRADVDAAALESELAAFGTVEMRERRAIVCVVGARLDDGSAREAVLSAIAAFHPELVSCGSTGAGLAAVLPDERLGEAVRGLHRRFFERAHAS